MTRLFLLILALSLTSCMSGSLKAPAKPAAVPATAVVTGESYHGVTLWYPTYYEVLLVVILREMLPRKIRKAVWLN